MATSPSSGFSPSDELYSPVEPACSLADPAELLNAYLDYYRDVVLRKLAGMSEQALRMSLLPSGWSPLELVRHLTFMEGRWFEWGFLARPVEQPWGDRNGSRTRWEVPAGMSSADVIAEFTAQAARSRAAVADAALHDRAAVGGRFASEAEAPTLAWTLFHVLQEYARHAGHLDVVRELSDGTLGE